MKKFALLLPILIAAAIAAQSPSTPPKPLDTAVVFTQAPFNADFHRSDSNAFLLNRAAGTGSRLVMLQPDGSLAILTGEFSAAADPSVSFDGLRILFSAKKSPADPWNIWEMDIAGGNKRQLTKDFGDCREPEYLAKSAITPPDFTDKVRWIAFTSNRTDAGPAGPSVLYVTNIEPIEKLGTVTRRATFNLCADFSPAVLSDGRVLFSSEVGCGGRSHPQVPLLAASWDGTGANLFCGAGQGADFKTMACETPDRHLVFVEPRGTAAGSRLARVSFRRPLRSYEPLSRDDRNYLNPRSLPDGRLIVSCTAGRKSYGLYLFDFARGAAGAEVYADSGWETLDAQPVVPRPEPQGLISSVIDSLKWGELFCLNVYDSTLPGMSRLKNGDVKTVRFFQGSPSESTRVRPLGDAPVENDGSFFVRVPADTPLRMQLLDSAGKTLQGMSRWMWVRRGTSRGCVGCHEDKELAPENRVPDAILRAEPHDLFSGTQK